MVTSEFAFDSGRDGRKAAPRNARDEWSVVREIGIEYAGRTQLGDDLQLRHPVSIERLGAHRHLIVDELGLEKSRTVQIECRTLVVDDDSQICFDSTALGVNDGFGCALADGRLALMRRTTWEVLIIAASGAVESRIDLCPVDRAALIANPGWLIPVRPHPLRSRSQSESSPPCSRHLLVCCC